MPKIVDDENVYRAARQAVIERGYAGATTKQIAAAAEISEVTLFRKYGSKAKLVKLAIAAMAEEMDFASATRYTGDVSADLLRVTNTYQRLTEENGQFMATILAEMSRRPELAGLIDTPMSMMGSIGKLLVRYQEDAVLREEYPLHAVAALLGPLMITNMIRGAADVDLPPIDLPNHVSFFLKGRRA